MERAHRRLFIKKPAQAIRNLPRLGSRKDLCNKAFWEEEEQWNERASDFFTQNKKSRNKRYGTCSDDGAAVFSNATQKVCAAKILRGEEAQWSERTAGFL